MIINKIEVYSEKELVRRLRDVGLYKRPECKAYQNADIVLMNMPIEDIRFAQYYVMQRDLDEIMETYDAVSLFCGIDIFKLSGFIRVFYTGNDGVQGVFDTLPPVVEESRDDGGIALLCDGMHRVYLAKNYLKRRNVGVVYLTGVSYSYYALPNENGWDDVQVVQSPPDIKKRYRIEDYKSVFRDFNSQFLNVSQSRK